MSVPSKRFVFSEEEKQLLSMCVDEKKKVVENKITNLETNIEKRNAWVEVTKRFNSLNSSECSVKQLHNLWKNMKKKASQVASSQRQDLFKTGGVKNEFSVDSPAGEFSARLHQMAVVRTPLPNPYDNDRFIENLSFEEEGMQSNESQQLQMEMNLDKVEEPVFETQSQNESTLQTPSCLDSMPTTTTLPTPKKTTDPRFLKMHDEEAKRREPLSKKAAVALCEHLQFRKEQIKLETRQSQEKHAASMELYKLIQRQIRTEIESAEEQIKFNRVEHEIRKAILQQKLKRK